MPAPIASPLNPDHMRVLQAASARSRKLRRASRVASFNGWTAAIFAACSAVAGFFSPGELVLAAALGAVAFVELRGARWFAACDARAPGMLTLNQLALGAVLVAYACWKGWDALHAPAASERWASADPEVQRMLADSAASIDAITRGVALALYATLALGSIAAQGLTAWYYASRARFIREYHAHTPAWAIEIERAVRCAA